MAATGPYFLHCSYSVEALFLKNMFQLNFVFEVVIDKCSIHVVKWTSLFPAATLVILVV
jgi:hypothetical protein